MSTVEDAKAIIASGVFDAEWYCRTYPDVLRTSLTPVEHFLNYGAKWGRTPSGDRGVAPDSGLVDITVLCTTYNHEKYIADAIEGFCRQKTKCRVEFIIADDCSTDRTADILREYAQRDSRIIPILRERNLGISDNFHDIFLLVKGRYVALCDGDDFWTDEYKLQKQFDFLEDNREYALCFHPVEIRSEMGTGEISVIFPDLRPSFMTADCLARENFIQTNSVMFRWRFHRVPDFYDKEAIPLDWYLLLLHAEIGKIGFMPDVMAVYRKHGGGMWANAGNEIKQFRRYGLRQIRLFHGMSLHFGGKYAELYGRQARYVFGKLADDYILNDECEALHGLCIAAPKEANAYFLELGYDVELENVADGAALRARLRAENRVSVITVARNNVATITTCITSVLAQRGCFDLDYIVCDNASDDDTRAQIQAAVSKAASARITVVEEKDYLPGMARLHQCLRIAMGEFIAICEADDAWISDRKLARQILALRRNPGHVFSCHPVESGPPPRQGEQGRSAPTEWPFGIAFEDVVDNPVVSGFSSCLYRAAALRKVPESYFQADDSSDWLVHLFLLRDAEGGHLPLVMSKCGRDPAEATGWLARLAKLLGGEKSTGAGSSAGGGRPSFQEGGFAAFSEIKRQSKVSPVAGWLVRFPELDHRLSSALTFAVREISDPKWRGKFKFGIDFRGKRVALGAGCAFGGWVLAEGLSLSAVVCEDEAGSITRAAFSIERPDVMHALRKVVGFECAHHPEVRCGFEVLLDYASPSKRRIGVEFTNLFGEQHVAWFAEVSLQS